MFLLRSKVKKKKDRRHLGAVISTDREENFKPIPFWLILCYLPLVHTADVGKLREKTQIKLRGYELSV